MKSLKIYIAGLIFLLACSNPPSNKKDKALSVESPGISIIPNPDSNKKSPLQSDNSTVLQVVCTKTPVYLKPSMKSRKASFKLNRGVKLTIIKKLYTSSKRSYDFGEIRMKGKTYFIPLQHLGPLPARQKMKDGSIVIGQELVDRTHPLPLDYQAKDLQVVPVKYRVPAYRTRVMKLRKEALKAFIAMVIKAKGDGVEIKLLSCYRSSLYQEIPYKRTMKLVGPKQRSSAKPGHSEHQLGTVADITTRAVGYQLTQSLAKTKTYRWIKKNAHRYGIRISYTKRNYKVKGYIWEPWHLRYWGKGRIEASN